MYVCMMYMYVCLHVWYVCTHACMYVCMHVCMYVKSFVSNNSRRTQKTNSLATRVHLSFCAWNCTDICAEEEYMCAKNLVAATAQLLFASDKLISVLKTLLQQKRNYSLHQITSKGQKELSPCNNSALSFVPHVIAQIYA